MDPNEPGAPEERDQQRTRLENEIREILERSDRPPSNVIKFRSQVQRNRITFRERMDGLRGRKFVTDLNILVAAVVFAVLGYLISDSSQALGRLFALLSIATFVWLFVRYFRRPDRHSAKTWRGRDIDDSPPKRPEWLDRRFGGPRRRR
jgi:hypothetical protein